MAKDRGARGSRPRRTRARQPDDVRGSEAGWWSRRPYPSEVAVHGAQLAASRSGRGTGSRRWPRRSRTCAAAGGVGRARGLSGAEAGRGPSRRADAAEGEPDMVQRAGAGEVVVRAQPAAELEAGPCGSGRSARARVALAGRRGWSHSFCSMAAGRCRCMCIRYVLLMLAGRCFSRTRAGLLSPCAVACLHGECCSCRLWPGRCRQVCMRACCCLLKLIVA